MSGQTYKFEKLEVWQLSLDLNDAAYELCAGLPAAEAYNLNSQLRRAATSVCLNIAEGSQAGYDAEQIRFLKIALRSLIEVIACFRLVERRGYPVANHSTFEELCRLLFAKLNAFISSLQRKQQP